MTRQKTERAGGRTPLSVELHMRQELEKLKSKQRYRCIPEIGERRGAYVTIGGRKLLNLSSNDYLGLGSDRGLFASWMKQFDGGGGMDGQVAMSSTSSRLLTGNYKISEGFESAIAEAYGSEAALVFNSGYHANTGILPALSTRRDLILCDKLSHASIIDGLRIADAEFRRYNHADYEQLERMLRDADGRYNQLFILTESVFSMDGDLADLERLVELKYRYGALLIVDEAHGVGIFGNRGLGLAEKLGLLDEIDILVGTLGKSIASVGAFAVMRGIFREYLINTMRTLMFTTALPPIVLAWGRMTFIRQLEMQKEREYLLQLAARLRFGLRDAGFDVPGESHIVPVLLGEDRAAVAVSEALNEAGFYVLPVRPPTVPENSARLRLSLRADLQATQIDRLVEAIKPFRA